MSSLFSMQLKIYFRQVSSYILPILLAAFFFIVILATRFTVKDPDNLKSILNAGFFITNFGNMAIFCAFIISGFIAQTIFYKYRQEGVEYILFSKSISKVQIYFANIFACLIGILFSIAIMSIGWFFSKIIYPEATFKMAFNSTVSYFTASLIAGLLALGIGSIVQAIVEMKVYLVISSIAPFLIILVLGFTRNHMNVENSAAFVDAQSKLIVNIPSKTGLDSNKNVANNSSETIGYKNLKKVEKQTSERKSFITSNVTAEDYQNYIDNKEMKERALTERVDKVNANVYRKMYWINFHEYYIPMLTLDNRRQRFEDEFAYYKAMKFKVGDNYNLIINRTKPNSADQYLINLLDNYLNLKVYDTDAKDGMTEMGSKELGINSVTYSSLSLDFRKLSERIKDVRGKLTIDEYKDLILNGATGVNLTGAFNMFEEIQSTFVDKILEYIQKDPDDVLVKANMDALKLEVKLKDVKNEDGTESKITILSPIKYMSEHPSAPSKFFDDLFNKGKLFDNDTIDKICNEAIDSLQNSKKKTVKDFFDKKINNPAFKPSQKKSALKELHNELYLAACGLIFYKYINDNNISFTKKALEAINNPDSAASVKMMFNLNKFENSKLKLTKEEISKMDINSLMNQNIISNLPFFSAKADQRNKLMDSNVITYQRRDPISPKYAHLYIIILSAAFMAIGLEIFIRKNFG